METLSGKQADTEYGSAALDPAGGGVCLLSSVFASPVDCVAWGTATVAGAGTSETAIPDGTSIVRDISPGCNTLLEVGDDSDSSLDDFAPSGLLTPQPNAEAGFNSSCPNTQITKKPKAKTTDRTPKFEFSGAATDSFAPSTGRRRRRATPASSSQASCRGASTSSPSARPRPTALSTAPRRPTPGRSSRRSSRLAACPGLEDPAQVVRTVGRVELERTAQATQCGAAN